MFQANLKHPLFKDVHSIIVKHVGLDKIVEDVVERLGDVEKVYLAGKFAEGLDSSIIDLIFVGSIDKIYLLHLTEKVEKLINRKVRYIIYETEEWTDLLFHTFTPQPVLLWTSK